MTKAEKTNKEQIAKIGILDRRILCSVHLHPPRLPVGIKVTGPDWRALSERIWVSVNAQVLFDLINLLLGAMDIRGGKVCLEKNRPIAGQGYFGLEPA